MKLVDARSGMVIPLPSAFAPTMWAKPIVIDHGGGDRVELFAVEPGIFSARAKVRTVTRMHDGTASVWEGWSPLQVRWTHPRFFGQHVAFIPS